MRSTTIPAKETPSGKFSFNRDMHAANPTHTHAEAYHRPEALIQRKLQALSRQSPQQQALAQLKVKGQGVDAPLALKPIRKQPGVLVQRVPNNAQGVIQ